MAGRGGRMSKSAFLDALRARLQTYSHKALEERVEAYGRRLPSAEYESFLALFEPHEEESTATEGGDDLLTDIDRFVEVLADEGYSEYRNWYDDDAYDNLPAIAEVEALIARCRQAYEEGRRELARDAYRAVFDSFAVGYEAGAYGHGDAAVADLVDFDMAAEVGRYLRCVYLTHEPPERVPAVEEALASVRGFARGGRDLEAMLAVEEAPLPDWEGYRAAWLEHALAQARQTPGHLAHPRQVDRLVEEVRHLRGAAGLAALAREFGPQRAVLYGRWADALREDGDLDGARAAAAEGVAASEGAGRAWLADRLAELCRNVGDAAAAVDADRTAWRSEPTLRRLLRLGFDAEAAGEDPFERYTEEHAALEAEEYAADGSTRWALQLLAGNAEPALQAMTRPRSVGWSSEPDPRLVVFPYLLVTAVEGDVPPTADTLGAVLDALDAWSRKPGRYIYPAAGLPYNAMAEEPTEHEADLLRRTGLAKQFEERARRLPVSPDHAERCLRLACDTAAEVVRTVLKGSYRSEYGDAAQTLAAVAELFHVLDRGEQGNAWLRAVRDEFPRHRAFHQELNDYIEDSGLLPDGLRRGKQR